MHLKRSPIPDDPVFFLEECLVLTPPFVIGGCEEGHSMWPRVLPYKDRSWGPVLAGGRRRHTFFLQRERRVFLPIMQLKLSRCLPGLGLLCVALLLCSVTGDSGQPCCLNPIYEYLQKYLGKNYTYAVAVILDRSTAEVPTNYNLGQEFTEGLLERVAQHLKEGNRTHQSRNLVAAGRAAKDTWWSAEGRLVEGGENSLMAHLIRHKPPDSTLVIFSNFAKVNNGYEWKEYMKNVREMQHYMGEFEEGHSSYAYTIPGGRLALAIGGTIRTGWSSSPYRSYVIIWDEHLGSRYVFQRAADVVPDAGRN